MFPVLSNELNTIGGIIFGELSMLHFMIPQVCQEGLSSPDSGHENTHRLTALPLSRVNPTLPTTAVEPLPGHLVEWVRRTHPVAPAARTLFSHGDILPQRSPI